MSLCEVYEASVTVTNWTGGKLNLGEGGEDLACPNASSDADGEGNLFIPFYSCGSKNGDIVSLVTK